MVRAGAAGCIPHGDHDERTIRWPAGACLRHGRCATQSRHNRSIHDDLAALDPPRKHYHWYYATRPANADMMGCPQGIHAFLRAYDHYKSADCAANKPYPLASWSARELAKLPTYYVMPLDEDMPATVAPTRRARARSRPAAGCPTPSLRSTRRNTPETGFQGGL
jgi:hypothetical protein